MKTKVLKPEEHFIKDEPYYQPIGEEIKVSESAYKQQLPVLLNGAANYTVIDDIAAFPLKVSDIYRRLTT